MKTTPTETDREAAWLFKPAPGMRAWRTTGVGMMSDPGMVIEVDPATAPHGGIRAERGWSWLPVCAIDADDPATVGCMVAQVEAAAGAPVELWHCPDDPPDAAHVVFVRDPSFESFCSPTRGAALVAAKRALAEAPK